MKNNKKLFSRLSVYVLVFVLVTISYINFTNTKDEKNLDSEQNVLEFDSVKAIDANEEELDEDMVLTDIDITDIIAEAEELNENNEEE